MSTGRSERRTLTMPVTARNTRKQPRRQAAALPTETSRGSKDDALLEFRNRRVARQLAELERTNAQDVPATSFASPISLQETIKPTKAAPAGLPASLAMIDDTKKNKKKQTTNVRNLLMYKKSLAEYLDELPEDHPYFNATPPASKVPARKICSSCGYTGAYSCGRCGEYSCSRPCLDVHEAEGGCGIGR
ncbi:hypothetical protein HD553DRAFT_303381 [Filobasidium floriforme]|uniref:uncharacterized protein n=1 Tax=Filobasidium floriforme TaxID=5210 RepID=UPI001E8CD92A|nr:uncharacterized protein HD553DRAFT_303381 [Filobasidium floriforme]KAH8090791.1 hypothetical protein HD553DRAFT_303381 [Filobasidium floriforme]